MTDVSKFKETRLPPKEAFASKLNAGTTNISDEIKAEDISDKKYHIVQEVFKEFQCKNLADFKKVYVEQDTIQLADVIDNFRGVCLKNYGLDPFHYISLSSKCFREYLFQKTNAYHGLLTVLIRPFPN